MPRLFWWKNPGLQFILNYFQRSVMTEGIRADSESATAHFGQVCICPASDNFSRIGLWRPDLSGPKSFPVRLGSAVGGQVSGSAGGDWPIVQEITARRGVSGAACGEPAVAAAAGSHHVVCRVSQLWRRGGTGARGFPA